MTDSDDKARFHRHNDALWHVGALLFNWGRLETQLTYSIVTMNPTVAGPHINPKNVARALEAILNKWLTVYCETTGAQIPQAKALKQAIFDASRDRNNICHGFSGVVVSPSDYTVGCWEAYHRNRMTGGFPPQRFYKRDDFTKMCGDLGHFWDEVARLTQVAIARPRKPRAPKAK